MRLRIALCLLMVSQSGLRDLAADQWDGSDGDVATNNEVVPGMVQDHDFATALADPDWFRIATQPYSSYEFRLDGLTPIGPGFSPVTLDLVDSTGAVITPSDALPSSPGLVRSVRIRNNTATSIEQFVRANDAASPAVRSYRIHVFETTVSIPRYNNTGSQVTVLIVQNHSNTLVSGDAYLWSSTGTLVTTVGFSLAPKAAAVTNLSTVNGGMAAGTGGTITISHDGRLGDLVAKAVALEPSTGFSFDSPGLYRPQ